MQPWEPTSTAAGMNIYSSRNEQTTHLCSVCVCAGEGHLMSWDEHIMLIAHTVNVYGDRLKVRGAAAVCSGRESQHKEQQQHH
jgi:dihydrodipicolinate synthase/N-acetylneuraminate lyase